MSRRLPSTSISDGGLGEFLSDGVLGEGSSPQVRFGEDMLASLIASCLANDWRFAGLTELLLSNSFPYSLSFPQWLQVTRPPREVKWYHRCGFRDLNTYVEYGDDEHQQKNKTSKSSVANPINGVLVVKWDGKDVSSGEEVGFVTSLPT